MAIQIRIAGYQDEQSVHTRAVRVLIGALQAKAGSHARVDFTPDISRAGRKVSDLLDLVKSGELDLCYFSSTYLAGAVPALGAFDVPFPVAERQDVQSRLLRDIGAILQRETAARTGYELLSFWDNGLRNLSNGVRPVRTPADCAGLKIRTTPNAIYHATFRALGMQPATIDVGDMVRAIAAGEVDAQENPLTNIKLFGLQKYHPFVTVTGHFHGIALVLGNAATLARWPEPVRSALRDALAEATAAQWDFAADDERSSRAALAAQGVHIVDLSADERAAFKDKVRPVIAQCLDALPPQVSRLLV